MELFAYALPVMGVVCLASVCTVVLCAGYGAVRMLIRAMRRKED